MPAFRDLLAWLLGWKSALAGGLESFGVAAGQVCVVAAAAGAIEHAGAAAAQVVHLGSVAGQIHG